MEKEATLSNYINKSIFTYLPIPITAYVATELSIANRW